MTSEIAMEIYKEDGFIVMKSCRHGGVKFILIAGEACDGSRFWLSGWRKFNLRKTLRWVEFTLVESGDVPADVSMKSFSGKLEDWQDMCESGYEKECEMFTQKCREWLGTSYRQFAGCR